jgi:hypothetical protein
MFFGHPPKFYLRLFHTNFTVFAFAGSVFMAGSTVTPPAPAASAILDGDVCLVGI